MQAADFGIHDGPMVLFGGPYSNLQALEALVKVTGDKPAICTGDVVGYSADPAATVALMCKLGWPVVAGNCERQLAGGAADCGCGFGVGGVCDLLSRGWYAHALASVDSGARAWMDRLPDAGTFVHRSRRFAVIHGGWTANNRFLWPSSAEADFLVEIDALEAALGPVDAIVAGHSGIAFHRRIGRHQWINAGVIGLPPHDGRPDTRYAVLENGEVTIHRLEYDFGSARAAMVQAGLTAGYDESLQSGLWPSEEILPSELRR